jgi:stage V sporulation protein G
VQISEVRIKLMDDPGERLQAFCSITFDNCFVIRDLKIIEGTNGPFVAMPSRKLTAHCPQCGYKNHLRAGFCNQCGLKLNADRAVKDEDGRAKLYADIAHPINSACREMIQDRVISAFREEQERSKLPGYVSTYDDYDEDVVAAGGEVGHVHSRPEPHRRPPMRDNRPREVARSEPPRVEQAPLRVEQTKVEPAQEPRGPHKLPAQQPQPRRGDAPSVGGFGEGIF